MNQINQINKTNQINQRDWVLVRGAGRFWTKPGCVLEDALRAGVVDELLATDETLLHRHLAPGAEAIGEVGRGRSRVRCEWSDMSHVRHSLRPLRTLSIDRVALNASV
jgi:hypothetical protein